MHVLPSPEGAAAELLVFEAAGMPELLAVFTALRVPEAATNGMREVDALEAAECDELTGTEDSKAPRLFGVQGLLSFYRTDFRLKKWHAAR